MTKAEADRHRFEVPCLRNVTATFPYFHDGSARDLAPATRTMARVQLDWEPTREETQSLVAFLESLTGTFQGRPLAEAPRDARTFAAPAAPPPPDGGTAPAPATQQ